MSIATHARALKTVGVYKVFQMCVQIYVIEYPPSISFLSFAVPIHCS